MFEEQITESIEAGAPDITYSGNEGPKSPQQEQQMMMQEQEQMMAGGENDRVRELLYKQETRGLSEIEKIELRELIKTISAGMQQQDQGMRMAGTDYSSREYRIKLIGQLMEDEGLDYGAASEKADWIIAKNTRKGAAYGGIMGLDGRKQYGFGSSLKKRFRKLIPNEVAKVAEVAAPFVAPFNPLAAGLMSGIGGFDRTGSIGSSLKSGLMNYGLGQGARYLGGADLQKGLNLKMPGATPGGGIGNYFSKPTGSNSRFFDNAFKSKSGPTTSNQYDIAFGEGDILSDKQGLIKNSSDIIKSGPTGIMETLKGFIPESTLGKVALGGGAIALGTALLGGGPEETVSSIMSRGEKLDIDGIRAEVTEAFKDSTGEKLLALRSKYPFLGTQASKNTAIMAYGGRARRAEGGLMNLGGMEKDYRAEGGFVPIGKEEKADDVPARLSVNEFVFTADAVRNAGGGDIDQGAEIMERVMKNLEQGGQISEETQGMSGAQEMFNVSERLGEVL